MVRAYRYDAGWAGTGEVWLEGDVVVGHEYPVAAPPEPVEHELAGRLEAFFRGEPVDFAGVELDLDGYTPFQLAVAEALRAIPRGEVVTYGELAALAGRPGAQRAAGTFCARNRYPVFLPCHRVVAAGGIGSYGASGVAVKRRLLELEGVAL